jgi:hypothetical protein
VEGEGFIFDVSYYEVCKGMAGFGFNRKSGLKEEGAVVFECLISFLGY